MSSAVEGLVANDFDAVITGGIDRNMGASTFVKFRKSALSQRPAPAPTPREPMDSSWAKARRSFC